MDYAIEHRNMVVPIEVKAGTTASLKSLHQFMNEKKSSLAVRINSETPSICPVQMKESSGKIIEYKLLSLPFYLLEQLHPLIQCAER